VTVFEHELCHAVSIDDRAAADIGATPWIKKSVRAGRGR
jgi:hypothetical protein